MQLSRAQLDHASKDWRRRATLAAMSATHDPRGTQTTADLSRARVDEWLEFAVRNRVGPIVAHEILELYRASEVPRAHKIHDDSASRMRVLLGELDRAAARLAREGIRVVALKNAGIARGIHPCAACCPMGDIDTLIDRRHFREAHRLLLELGFSHASRAVVEPAELEAGIASGGTEYVALVGGEEVWLELQWRPVAGRWIRRDQEPEGAELLARAVPLPGTEVCMLAPDDNMVQVSLHTAKHSYVRAPGLRLHTDVDRLATFAAPDWGRVAAKVRELEVETAVFLSLAISAALLDAPVPPAVLGELAPPRWKVDLLTSWLRRVDLFEPDARKFSRPAMMAFHALLYDSVPGLVASVFDTDPGRLGVRHLPRNMRAGVARLRDLATRYQR